MSLEIKRPKGVKVFVVIAFLDAAVLAIVLVVFFATPELYTSLFDVDSLLAFQQEYTILKFNDRVLELTILSIVIDALAIIGLLSAKPLGRKLAIGSAVAGIAFYLIGFVIPGLVTYSIMLWYLFRTHTKEYFENKTQLN